MFPMRRPRLEKGVRCWGNGKRVQRGRRSFGLGVTLTHLTRPEDAGSAGAGGSCSRAPLRLSDTTEGSESRADRIILFRKFSLGELP